MKKKKPETIWFENSEGQKIGFPAKATIADMVKAGVLRVTLVEKGTKPTKNIYIGPA